MSAHGLTLEDMAARLAALETQVATLTEHLEDRRDAEAAARGLAAFEADPDGLTFPIEIVEAELKGDSRLRAWRKYRKLTLAQLAEATGLAKSYLSEMEAGRKVGQLPAWQKIAQALGISVGHLVD